MRVGRGMLGGPRFHTCFMVLLTLILQVSCASASPKLDSESFQTVKGEFDIRNWDFERQGPVSLEGYWELWNDEFVEPRRDAPMPPSVISYIPYTKSVADDASSVKPTKHGTYRARLLVNDDADSEHLAFQIRGYHAAAGITLVADNGTSEQEIIGQLIDNPHISDSPFVTRRVDLPNLSGATYIDIFIQFATPSPIRFGLWVAPQIGPSDVFEQARSRKELVDTAVLAILLFLGLYHAGLFALRRKDRGSLLFAIAAISYAFMVLYGSQIIVHWIERDIGIWTGYLYKLAYLAGFLLVISLGWFYSEIFGGLRRRVTIRYLTWYSLGCSSILLIAGIRTFEEYRWIWDLGVAAVLVGAFVDIVIQSFRGERFAGMMLCAFGVVASTAIHDLLMVYGYISSFWLSQYGFLAFMVIQSYLLAVRNSEAHRVAERLSAHLQEEVESQTHALQTQTVESDHLRKLAEKQAVELREYDERKTRFFQNISHELRTPLTLMLHPLDAALEERAEDENLLMARRNCARLLRLVNQLLDFQKLSVGTQDLTLGPIDVLSFLRVTSDYFASSSAHRALRYSVTVDAVPLSSQTERRVVVLGELDGLEKVIFNYLSNALKFSEDGGTIELGVLVEPSVVRFFVRDSGPGIHPQDQVKLFQIFSQLDDSSTRAYEGTGLGLALCKSLATQMNGEVGVQSVYGEGATFWLELPRSELEAPALDESFDPKPWLIDWSEDLPGPGGSLEASGGDEHIVVVDDLADMRNMIGRVLTDRGYRVSYAGDGQAALELMAHEVPDLLVTDWMMPRMDGSQLVEAIRSDARTHSMPVIMLTAKSDEGSRLEGLERGADAFLGKPFSTLELSTMVRNLLNLKRKERALSDYSTRLENALDALKVAELQKVEAARLSTLGQLASGLAHELRNPLNVIHGVAETLDESSEDAALTPMSRLLSQASERADGVVKRLITLSESQPSETSCRLGDAITSMSDIVTDTLTRQGMRLEVKGDLELRVTIGRSELSQVLVQLVQNAMEAGAQDDIIRIVMSGHDDSITVTVEDHGHGIDENIRDSMFDAFVTTRLERNASGLGLTIARRLVREAGGDLSVSQTNDPTAFCVTVPASKPEDS